MSLGQDFSFLVSVNDVAADEAFFACLGYQRLSPQAAEDGSLELGDGAITIALRPAATWETLLILHCRDLEACRRKLVQAGIAIEAGDGADRLTALDPDGHKIQFVESPSEAIAASGRSPGRRLGAFGEYSLETSDLQKSEKFWRKLGFQPTRYAPDPVKDWTSLSDGLLMVGLYGRGHVPHAFSSPAITYFEANMRRNIRSLEAEGLAFVQKLGDEPEPPEAIVQSPGGQMVFLFAG